MTPNPEDQKRKESKEFEALIAKIPNEWLEPERRFKENDYPCPRCGKQLPRYGEGIHFCK